MNSTVTVPCRMFFGNEQNMFHSKLGMAQSEYLNKKFNGLVNFKEQIKTNRIDNNQRKPNNFKLLTVRKKKYLER